MRNLSSSFNSSFKKHRLYKDFIQVQSRLALGQFVCWVAGGAVRDLYIGREVYDFDLVTDASTENLKKIFPEAVLVGESFGVLKIPTSTGDFFDLATFREESDYIDGRRPSAVRASTPVEDAKRRDFTINALFWDDHNSRLIDFVGGVQDLELQKLKCVGLPEVRFGEDHLRIVRLIRFAAQLGFAIDSSTEVAAKNLISQIQKVSGERIWIEMKKIAGSRNWNFVLESSLFRQFIQEIFGAALRIDFLKKHNISKVSSYELECLFFVLINIEADHNEVQKILSHRLKLAKTELLIFEQMLFALNHLKAKSIFEICLQIEKRDGLKNTLIFLSQLGFFEENLVVKCEKILGEYPQALVNGRELMSFLKGPEIGQALDEIRLLQFQDKVKTNDEALQLIRRMKSP